MAVDLSEVSLIKKPNIIQKYTPFEMEELNKCADPDNGFLHFMRNYYYVQSYRGKTLFKPYDYQLKMIEAFHNYDKVVALLPRQSGKCVNPQTKIKLRNKTTGIEYEMEIGEFYDNIKNNS